MKEKERKHLWKRKTIADDFHFLQEMRIKTKYILSGSITTEMERWDAKKRRRRRRSKCLHWKASTHEMFHIFFPNNREQKNGSCRHEHQTNKKNTTSKSTYAEDTCSQTHTVKLEDTKPKRGWRKDHSKESGKLSLETEHKTGNKRVTGTTVTVRGRCVH